MSNKLFFLKKNLLIKYEIKKTIDKLKNNLLIKKEKINCCEELIFNETDLKFLHFQNGHPHQIIFYE